MSRKIRLLQDVRSNNKTYYGSAGEEVELISEQHGNTLLVRGKDTFPVHRDLTDIDRPGAPLIGGPAPPPLPEVKQRPLYSSRGKKKK
jgi:hypothetical protein